MKKIAILSVLMLLIPAFAMAQKYAFVDSDYIRKNIPAFNTAQDQLDKLSKQWEKEVSDCYAVVEQMYKSYQNDAVLLSQDMKTKREEAIIAKEKEMKELQNKYFGMDTLIKNMLSAHSPISKYELSEYWLDIGRIDDYEIAQKDFNDNFYTVTK